MLNDLPKTVVYQLKQLYGVPADLYHIVSITDDILTGKSTTDKVKYRIRRAVCLPVKTLHDMSIPGAFKKDNNFPSQSFTVEDRLIIIDRRDLPKDFAFGEKDYIVTHYKRRIAAGKRFNIAQLTEFEDDRSVVILGKFIKGGQVAEIVDTKSKETLPISEELS